VASKSAQHEPEKAEVIEEFLEIVDKTLDRVKVLYEQFFLGIQKQPPTHLHTDVDRKLRDLQQMQIRNTGLRYRFATIQQKFGSYNNYWRRTLRQIENGTYHRNLAKLSRKAVASGEDIPDEILAAMPKRMREQVLKDREAAIAKQRERAGAEEFVEEDATETSSAPKDTKTRGGAHVLADDDDFDLDAYFASVTNDDAPDVMEAPAPPPKPQPAPRAPASNTPAARAAGIRIAPAQPKQDFEEEDSAVLHSGIPRDVEPRPNAGIPLKVGRTTPVQGIPVVRDDDESTSPVLVPPTRQSQPVMATRQSQPVMPTATARQSQPVMPGAVPPTTQGQAGTARQSQPVMPGAVPPIMPVASPPTTQGQGGATRQSQPVMPSSPTRQSQPVMPAARQSQPVMPSAPEMTDADEATSPVAVPPRPPPGRAPAASPHTDRQPIVSPARAPTPPPRASSSPGEAARAPTPQSNATQPIGSMRMPTPPPTRPTTSPGEPPLATQPLPKLPTPGMPSIPKPPTPAANMPTQAIPKPAAFASSQNARPLNVMPGSSAKTGPVAVESMNGPFPREQPPPEQPAPRPVPKPAVPPQPIKPIKPARAQTDPGTGVKQGPPPGMTDADVNALYAKYVKAKEAVGEKAGPGSYGKLLQTINAQAPKIMEQYKARSVDFSVVVKDNQDIIKAKPKT
jgi:hypothetical protein